MTPEEEQSVDLRDVALADEIELVSDLVVAASSSPRHFTLDEVDQLLGVSRGPDTEATPEEAIEATPDVTPEVTPGPGAGATDEHPAVPEGPSLSDPAS